MAASDWQPVSLGPDFSPELQSLLLSDHRAALLSVVRRRDDALRTKIKKHLLALGWTIASKPSSGLAPRLRYVSPAGGKSYYSLPRLIRAINLHLLAPPPRPPPHDATQSPSPSQYDSCGDTDTILALEESDEEDAIAAYVAFMEEGNGSRGCRQGNNEERRSMAKELRTKAKEQLRSSGWTFSMKVNKIKKKRAAPSASCNKRKKKAGQLARLLQPRPRNEEGSRLKERARTLLSVLMDKNILASRDKLTYRTKRGLVTGDGMVKCMCDGCNRKALFTVSEFTVHGGGGGSASERPWAHMFVRDGRSLSQCLVQLMAADDGAGRRKKKKTNKYVGCGGARVKRKWSEEDDDEVEGDYVCSVCHECGELLMCDSCPSMFHHACVGLEATPPGDWFCPACSCTICGSSDFDDPAKNSRGGGGRFSFGDKTIIYCDQCQREYHVGCVRGRGWWSPEAEGPWLCSQACSKIYLRLEGLARAIPIPIPSWAGLSLVVLRRGAARDRGGDEKAQAEEHAKLCMAFDVLHECFVTLIEPRTQTDLTADIVFNTESELRRLDFQGFYVVGLEKRGELITVATLRVYGDKVAELPLVGTRFAHRRQGMCRLLMNELDKLLGEMGVERVVLPVVAELVATWTGSFGFREMGQADRQELAYHAIVCFQGTTMCHKLVPPQPQP
ncbi:hypothetical protein E2562_026645 [Oryza meyeriana var. granulata]|uniref:PHD-type domain-containing protein n=1 Tax=Oryza meyeriana var. granulata TaxID=110450 RepID=A0A6G1D862_9ORYZ|nr:hypothetical protein E2562_026645 [Oryza meyeriana var. granulata]